MRNTWLSNFTERGEERLKSPVDNFHCLLGNIGTERFIILAGLADVVVGYVVEIFFIGEVELVDAVESFIVKIFRQTAKQSQRLILGHGHSGDLLFNRKIHQSYLPSWRIVTKFI